MTAPAMFVAQYIEREWNQATVCVVPHGIGDEFSFSERSHQKRFMYAGTITRMKGIHFLIRAFIRLQDKSATLDIYGDGDKQYTRELQKLARVDPRIMFHLRVEPTHIPEIYRKHDVVVIPSIVPETYNYVVREGLCCGCLAVVANIGALPEAIDDGRNGFSFIPGDENSLLQALEKADRFDWNMYKNPKFSSIQQEYETYKTLYSNMTQTKTKF